jgi:hypothetical protein
MAHSTPVAIPENPALTGTTPRGFATASFCFGCWSSLVFWWYPYGPMLALLAVLFGMVSMAMGIRAGLRKENLALGGVILGGNAIGLAFASYRGVQFFFEGISPLMP